MVYQDFSKALNRVPHLRPVKRVEANGIDGEILKWIQVSLSCRKQRVQSNGKNSDWRCLTRGVPQGSVFGPLLFTIIMDWMRVLIMKLAGDTKVSRLRSGYKCRVR